MRLLISLFVIVAALHMSQAFYGYWNYQSQIEHYSFDNTTDVIFLGSSQFALHDYIIGASSNPHSTGLVLHPTKVEASDGFQLEFFWGQKDCSPRNASLPAYGADGFAVVFTKDLPTNAQVQSSVGTLGVGRIPNAYVFGYSSTYKEFYFCHWNEPLPIVQSPGALRSRCQAYPYARTFNCGDNPYFVFRSFYDFIEVWDGWTVILTDIPFKMDAGQYHLGFGFGNDNYYRTQELQGYAYYYRRLLTKFNLSEVNPQLTEVVPCGHMRISDNLNFDYYLNALQFGSAYLTNVVHVDSGFVTRFTWTPYQCDEQGIGGDGFAFFLSSFVPSCLSYRSPLGIEGAANMTIVGYSALNDKFYLCQWDAPATSIYQGHSACVSVTNPLPRMTCGQSYKFAVYYDSTTIQVYVQDELVASRPLQFEDRPYFAGFSVNAGDTFYFKQNISDWILETDLSTANLSEYFPVPVSETPQPSPPNTLDTPSLVFLGTAEKINNKIQLTSGGSQSGLVYYSQPVRDRASFESTFTWTPTNCDVANNGADGWTFFLAKNVPTLEQVQSSAGGLLGIQNVPNVAMAAYSATFNEFFVANWTEPFVGNIRWESVRVPAPGAKYTCDGVYTFSVVYSEPNISILLDNQVMISAPIVLDSVPYYYGLSGATGGGYFQQDVTNWTFTRRLI